MPKNLSFYALFESVVDVLQKMGDEFKLLTNEPDRDRRASSVSKLEDFEHQNDELTHEILTELSRNFITPFDREDIHALAMALDDIADCIYASAKKIHLYHIDPNEANIRNLAVLIASGTDEVLLVVSHLRDMKDITKIKDSLIRIDDIENEADKIYDQSIQTLFQVEDDVKLLIKKREIIEIMEKVVDKLEDAANTIEAIVIKYS